MSKPSSTQTKAIKATKKRKTSPFIIEKMSPLSNGLKLITSFLMSFCIVIGFVLGLNWYGKQAYSTLMVVLRPAPTKIRHLSVDTQFFDPIDLTDPSKRSQIVLIDVRSLEEYQKEHIIGAISRPLYTTQNKTLELVEDESVSTEGIDKTKTIVVYGPSNSFQHQQVYVSELKKLGFDCKLLAVGWNELRHFQNIWIPEGLWGKIDVNDIIQKNDIQ